jgi:hypothetical protein
MFSLNRVKQAVYTTISSLCEDGGDIFYDCFIFISVELEMCL